MTAAPASSEGTRAKDLRQLARHSGLNLAGSVVAAALNLVLPILVTRGLGQADAGIFFQATAIFTVLVTVGAVGADTGVLRFLPRAMALSRPADVAPTMRTAVLPPLLVSIVLAATLAAVAGPLGDWATGDDSTLGDEFAEVIRLLSLFLPLAVLYAIGLAASRGLNSMLPLVAIEKLGRGSTQLAAAGLSLALTSSVLWLALAWSLPYVAALLLLTLWLVERTRRTVKQLRRQGSETSEPTPDLRSDFWRFALPRALSRVFSVALQRADIVLVGALRGPADAAVYAVATRFPILGLMFVQAIQQVMAPRISEFLAVGSHERALTLFRTTTAWLILVSWPIYLTSVWFAPLLLDVFGSGYDEAATAVVVLCLAMLVATACGPVDSVLLMGGRSGLSLLNTGLALTVTVGADLLLIPEYGVLGAAIGWSIGIVVNNMLPLWQVHRTMSMHPVGAATRRAVLVSAGCFGVLLGGFAVVGGMGLAMLIVGGLVASAAFAACLWWSREVLDLQALAAAASRRRRGSRAGS